MSGTLHRVQVALDETRMLMLGTQVLLGFAFQAVLERAFTTLPSLMQMLKLVSLSLLLLTLVLLLWPAAFHQIVERGHATATVHRFTTRVMSGALVLFALALGMEVAVASSRILDQSSALVAGTLSACVALACWYGPWLAHRPGREAPMVEQDSTPTPLKDRIREVLTEARMVLPGVQALLGFQLIALLAPEFTNLPRTAQYVHLACLGLVALSTVLLMSPAAYHRTVLRGEDTEGFHRLASRLLLAAMVPLPLGLSGDFYIVVERVTGSTTVGVVTAALALAVFLGAWFGVVVFRRPQRGLVASATGIPRML